MNKLGLLYNEEVHSWAEYFNGVFGNLDDHVQLETLLVQDEDFVGLFRKFVTDYETIVILVSPGMKVAMLENADMLNSLLQKTNIIMLLCGTGKQEFDRTLRGAYQSSSWWTVLEVKDNNDDNEKVANLILRTARENSDYKMLNRSKFKNSSAKIFPKHVSKPGEKVVIVFKASFSELIYISFSDDPETRYPTRMMNRQTFSFEAPDHKTGTFQLSAFSGTGLIGSWPFTFDTPDVTAYQSVAFLCDVLNVTPGDTVALDTALCEQFNATHPVPGLDNLLTDIVKTLSIGVRSERKIPSLLHFAALHGLSEFFLRLMDMPGFLRVFEIENSEGKNPADMAEGAGHAELAEYIRKFVETQCLSDIYDFSSGYMHMNITPIYENPGEESTTNDNAYIDILTDAVDAVYEDMSINAAAPPVPEEKDQNSVTFRTKSEKRNVQSQIQRQSILQPRLFEGRVRVLYPPAALGCECQYELIQLQNQVKDNYLSIEEALREFQHWKERNEDGSKSFKERKATLDRFRKECKGELRVIEKGSDNLSDNNPLAKLIRRIRNDQHRLHLDDGRMDLADQELSMSWRQQRDSTLSTSSSSSCYSTSSRDSGEFIQDKDKKRSSIPLNLAPPPPDRPAHPLPSTRTRPVNLPLTPPEISTRPARPVPPPKPNTRDVEQLNLSQAHGQSTQRIDDQTNANIATSPSYRDEILPPVPLRHRSDPTRQPLPSPPHHSKQRTYSRDKPS